MFRLFRSAGDRSKLSDSIMKNGSGAAKDVYLVAGLGNPGKKYDGTRHNVGFDTLDIFIDDNSVGKPSKKFNALIGSTVIDGKKVFVTKPLTYMNRSGDAIRKIAEYYGIDVTKKLIVISDEINLPPGKIRIRKKGSAGGHNGLKNIIENLGTDEFIRIRIGVGDNRGSDLVNHVLSPFSKADKVLVAEAEQKASDAVRCIIEDGPDKAMNLYN